MRPIAASIVLLAFAQSTIAAEGIEKSRGKIVVDASKDDGVWWFPQGEGRFDSAREHRGKRLADHLRSLGWEVEELRPGEDVSRRFAGATLVIRAGFKGSYRPSEATAYRDFVTRGGGLVLLRGPVPPGEDDADAVARAFGITFGGRVRGLGFSHGSPLQLGWNPLYFSIGYGSIVKRAPTAAIPLAYVGERELAMGIVQHGKGKVFFASTILGFLHFRPESATMMDRLIDEVASHDPIARLVPRTAPGAAPARAGAAENAQTRLIGQKAAPVDVETWVNGPPLTDADLKGKVVLLDFWAVWCGPCIATFPHLREWNAKYAGKGLVIVGLTNYYNYEWDVKTGRAKRSEDTVPHADEQAMLVKFAAQHGLTHRLGIPSGGSLAKFYGVTSIPQAVVIDREGIVRLIKVGSGEANATAIEALLKQLLAPAGAAAG
jgi:thiol-disulfide isomerase/thioredoxin